MEFATQLPNTGLMAGKARLIDDQATLQEILEAPDPKAAKALGRKVKNFDGAVWEANARRLVTEGNVAKFGQNKDPSVFLLSTKEVVLVEASPYDQIWGIGLKATDERAKHPHTWQGQNLLGFALMDVREGLAGYPTPCITNGSPSAKFRNSLDVETSCGRPDV